MAEDTLHEDRLLSDFYREFGVSWEKTLRILDLLINGASALTSSEASELPNLSRFLVTSAKSLLEKGSPKTTTEPSSR
jgi:hypothetical protein